MGRVACGRRLLSHVGRLTATVLLLLAFPGCSGAAPADAYDSICVVQRIVDGDTLVCSDGDRVRLLLIDAPELSQRPFGARARSELDRLAPRGTRLGVELDVQHRDRYGRKLAYLWLSDGRMVNEELLLAGVAVVSVHPPNVRHVQRLRDAVNYRISYHGPDPRLTKRT
jgi:micrococcal nuclease